jgi:hypothetical protein
MSESDGPPSRPKGEGNYSSGAFKPGSQPLSPTGSVCDSRTHTADTPYTYQKSDGTWWNFRPRYSRK